jgi:hypothetical protein
MQFHNANFFGSCIIHFLYTGCAEIKKNNSGAKGLMIIFMPIALLFKCWLNIATTSHKTSTKYAEHKLHEHTHKSNTTQRTALNSFANSV